MRATITVDLENAAFEPRVGEELARILAPLCDLLPSYSVLKPGFTWPLHDANGNTVGRFKVTK